MKHSQGLTDVPAAREASKRIVEDLLLTAGAGREVTDGEDSPSMVTMKDDILDDSF
jgi:DASH complex subunit ASK1